MIRVRSALRGLEGRSLRYFSPLGAPFRWALLGTIRLYQATLSGWLGGQCRFYPSCSHYAEEAIRTRGAVRGSALAMWRVLRCNPFGTGGVDRVPGGSEYETVTHEDRSTGATA